MEPSYKTGGWAYGGGRAGRKLMGVWGVFFLLPTTLVNSEVWLKQATLHQRQAKIYWYVLWYVEMKNAPKGSYSLTYWRKERESNN